jgi:hypothetical protein
MRIIDLDGLSYEEANNILDALEHDGENLFLHGELVVLLRQGEPLTCSEDGTLLANGEPLIRASSVHNYLAKRNAMSPEERAAEIVNEDRESLEDFNAKIRAALDYNLRPGADVEPFREALLRYAAELEPKPPESPNVDGAE